MSPQRRRHNGKICPLNTGILLTLGLLLALAHPAEAQFIGDRIRITTESGEEITGELQGYDDSSLTLLADSAEQSVAYDDMAKLQRSLGIRSNHRKGAGIGLTVGVGGSVVTGFILRDGYGTGAWATLIGVGFFTPMVVLGGVMAGAAIKREKWKLLDIPEQNPAFVIPDIDDDADHPSATANRIRIKTENKEITGQLQGYDAHSMTILTDSTEQTIAYADMTRLQSSFGTRSQYMQGGIIGSSVGMFSLMGTSDMKLAIGLGGLGGLAGAIIGTRVRREKWNLLDIPEQDTAAVTPGIDANPAVRLAQENRMRIKTENDEIFIGRIKEYDAHSMTILANSTEQRIAYADMARLQRSVGRRGHPVKGALIGFVTGTLLGIRSANNIEQSTDAGTVETFAAIATVLLGSGGGIFLGTIFGEAIQTERWEPLDIPGQERGMSVAPVIGVHPNGRLALGARISF